MASCIRTGQYVYTQGNTEGDKSPMQQTEVASEGVDFNGGEQEATKPTSE